MPMNNYKGFLRMTGFCKTKVFGNLIGQVVEIFFSFSVFIQVSRINYCRSSVPGWLYRLKRMYCSLQGQILDSNANASRSAEMIEYKRKYNGQTHDHEMHC
ncbi:hypothetical protein DCAR_0519784 [Daucus carota subsp. sativus]|uniref:Uncharacterized protein n=1 Tax=Daucus carota subsp. sativus TaxID=79200 RepID=A0A164Y6Q1_DAUCS|nr:hypothetical protein DCAR_0519784 [Daucus carota subsp. sativus]